MAEKVISCESIISPLTGRTISKELAPALNYMSAVELGVGIAPYYLLNDKNLHGVSPKYALGLVQTKVVVHVPPKQISFLHL